MAWSLATDWPAWGLVDEVAELVAAGDAELGVGVVQVVGDGAGGQEQAVGDVAVGQALAGQDDDLALLRGQVRERAGRGGRRLGGDAAGPEFCVGAAAA